MQMICYSDKKESILQKFESFDRRCFPHKFSNTSIFIHMYLYKVRNPISLYKTVSDLSLKLTFNAF